VNTKWFCIWRREVECIVNKKEVIKIRVYVLRNHFNNFFWWILANGMPFYQSRWAIRTVHWASPAGLDREPYLFIIQSGIGPNVYIWKWQWIICQSFYSLWLKVNSLSGKIESGNPKRFFFFIQHIEKFQKSYFPFTLDTHIGIQVIQGGLREDAISRTP